MAITLREVWPFTEGSGTNVNEVLTGAPDLQGFGTNGTWSEDGASTGDGWGWINQFLAAPNVTGNAIDALNGATQATLIVAFKTGTTLPGNGEIVAEIGQDESPNTNQRFGFGFQGSGSDELRARVNNATVISHASPIFSANTWYVCVLVYDSPNATAADRARFWVSGTRVGTTEAITRTRRSRSERVPTRSSLASRSARPMAGSSGPRSRAGAASDAEVATITSALGVDNDITDPLAGGGGDIEVETGLSTETDTAQTRTLQKQRAGGRVDRGVDGDLAHGETRFDGRRQRDQWAFALYADQAGNAGRCVPESDTCPGSSPRETEQYVTER